MAEVPDTVDDALDALGEDPTADEVVLATAGFSAREVAAAAARRAGGGGVEVTDGTTTVAATTLQVPAGTVTDEGGGVAGVAVQTRLLGPFHVTYDQPEIGTSEIALTPLNAGDVIVRAWMVATVTWQEEFNATADYLIGVGLATGGIDPGYAIQYSGFEADEGPIEIQQQAVAEIKQQVVHVVGANKVLTFEAYSNGTGFISGEADIYALIAVPA